MATTKLSKKDVQQDEFIDTVFDFGEWLEAHWKTVAGALGAVVAVVLIGFAWNASRQRAAEEANALLARGMNAYAPEPGADGSAAAPNFGEALSLFEQAADKGGSQPVGDVARLFRARTLMAMGRGSEAVPLLETLGSSSNERLAGQAKVSLAEAVSSSGDAERAATILQEVASSTTGSYPPDAALMLLGGVRERQGKTDDAKRVYDDLVARFPQSPFAADARQRVADLAKTR